MPSVDPLVSPDHPAFPEPNFADPGSDDRKPRTLILCFDGTASQYNGYNTNVVRFYALLKKDDDNSQQLCYYQPGVGTYLNPGVVSPLFQWGAKMLDEAFAWYLDAHVRGGYQFLMQNYNAGDRICLFGFSRGAYTARALAGMLHKIGLLPRDNPEQIPFAYNLYTKTDKDSLALAAGFKQTFCRTVDIEFIGVWDTVASVGVLMSRTLPFTTTNTTIKKFRHALALDEHRVKFCPNFYHRVTSSPVEEASSNPSTSLLAGPSSPQSHGPFKKSWKSAAKIEKTTLQQNKVREQLRKGQAPTGSTTSSLEAEALGDQVPGGTDILEVWFAGCHGDVGGGSVADDVGVSLSDITLRWMVREVVAAQCGIAFDDAALVRANIPESIFRGVGFPLPAQATLSPVPHHLGHRGFVPADDAGAAPLGSQGKQARPGDEGSGSGSGESGAGSGQDSLDAGEDALQPAHDALKSTPTWWILEILPIGWPALNKAGQWGTRFCSHLGRGRQAPVDQPMLIHETVRERMQDPNLKYTPRTKWKRGTEIYVS
ncbi:hypothetical protein BC628DRAFT_1327757 [Trametes gibbosa]|nr:hypothetical protein BC628DRAFT_1327757 [Trametes gibbosa]